MHIKQSGQLAIMSMLSLSFLNLSACSTNFFVNFHQSMICAAHDSKAYQKAYTNNPEDQALFNFADENYRQYILETQAYSDIPRIPKIIHQIWIGPNNPPEKFKEWQHSWLSLHPDWEYKLWTDKEVENLYMVNKKYYDEEKNYGAKADILRLEILNQFGGLYVDIDFECLKPFDALHHLCDFYIGFFQVNFLKSSARVNNALIAACPNHPILQILINDIKKSHHISTNEYDIVERTGPGFVTKVLKKYIYHTKGINILFPANYFYPWSGTRRKLKLLVQPETMAIHHYAGTWHQKKRKKFAYPDRKSSEFKKLQVQRLKKKQQLLQLYT